MGLPRRGVVIVSTIVVLVAAAWVGESYLHRWRLAQQREELEDGRRGGSPELVARNDAERSEVLLDLARTARSWSEDELAAVLERGASGDATSEEIVSSVLASCGSRRILRRKLLPQIVAQIPDCAALLAEPLLVGARDPNADVDLCRELLEALRFMPEQQLRAAMDAQALTERDRAGLRKAIEVVHRAFPDVHPVALLREEHLRVGADYDRDVPLPRVSVRAERPGPEPWKRGGYDKPMPARTSQPRRFGVDAVDADTGEKLTPNGVALLRDGEPEALATGSGRVFRSDVEPQVGDRVLVHVKGRDPAVVTWNGETSLPVPIGPPSTTEITVRLDPGRHEDHGFALLVRHGMGAPGLRKAAVYSWQQLFAKPGKTLQVVCPAGAQNWLTFEHPAGLPLTPQGTWAAAGDEVVLRHAPVRDVRVVDIARDGDDIPELAYAAFAVDPEHPVDEQVAANVRRWSPFGGHLCMVRDDLGRVLADVPAIGLHVFFTQDGVPRYVHVPQHGPPDLPARTTKRVLGRPFVDGAPVPEMTILAPGRLDLDTARGVSCRAFRVFGYSLAVHDALDWDAAELPDAEWLTAYHPSFGVAYLRWAADDVPAGEPEPGALVLRAAESETLEGAVRIKPIWRTTQRSWTGSSQNPMHIELGGRAEVALSGLPLGLYSVQIDVLTGERDEESMSSKESFEIDLTAREPRRVHVVR